ncbi:hypothetical protein RJ639_016493 [Escallonia herrerae]|uniref:Epidermal patterning factor-like protein n=1 Tax=Escallonia herrerae TaxID=1293975 RepID=A0AA89ALW4_9ASTE|nr:hypothetical protein RJ639_016493 [Escallonia herrerae]
MRAEKIKAGKRGVGVAMSLSMQARTRRFLGGPGSWPPRCTSKCGRCSPCRPVHVPVPPGTPVTTEYYPEAWRHKFLYAVAPRRLGWGWASAAPRWLSSASASASAPYGHRVFFLFLAKYP